MEILLVLQIIVVVALIAVILVQKTGADGFTGGGSPNSFLTGRASANLFTRTTSILATVFIVNSLVLAYIASHTERSGSIIEQAAQEAEADKKAGGEKTTDGLGDLQKKLEDIKKDAPQPATPSVPVSE